MHTFPSKCDTHVSSVCFGKSICWAIYTYTDYWDSQKIHYKKKCLKTGRFLASLVIQYQLRKLYSV